MHRELLGVAVFVLIAITPATAWATPPNGVVVETTERVVVETTERARPAPMPSMPPASAPPVEIAKPPSPTPAPRPVNPLQGLVDLWNSIQSVTWFDSWWSWSWR